MSVLKFYSIDTLRLMTSYILYFTRIQLAIINQNGVKIEPITKLNTKWNYQGYLNRASEKLHNA